MICKNAPGYSILGFRAMICFFYHGGQIKSIFKSDPSFYLTRLTNMYILAIFRVHIVEKVMKKTTVVIDQALLKAAIEAIGARTKKEAIEAGLRSLVRNANREAFRKELGTFEIDLTMDELEQLRHAK